MQQLPEDSGQSATLAIELPAQPLERVPGLGCRHLRHQKEIAAGDLLDEGAGVGGKSGVEQESNAYDDQLDTLQLAPSQVCSLISGSLAKLPYSSYAQ
jgi:hypothetical protein